MTKLKVLQLCHDYQGPFVSVCSMYLKAFDSSKYEVTTVFLRGERDQFVEDSMKDSRVIFFELAQGSLSGMKIRAILKTIALCRREKFDMVVAHRYKPIFVAGIASLLTPFKLVLGVAHEHDVFARLGRRLFLRFLRPNIKVVGVSESVKSDILSCCPTLKDRERVYSLPNCIDADQQQIILGRQAARDALDIPSFGYVFGTVGRLVRKKEHEVLLQALAHPALQDCCVVIIGEGPRRPWLEQLAKDLGIDDRVVFSGHVHQAFKYIKAFNAFVLASGEKEAFGLVLLEAMMAEVPIICSDANGPREVVGETGLLFTHGDSTDLSAKMLELRDASKETLAQYVGDALERLDNHYKEERFIERFWELPPLTNYNSQKSDTVMVEILSTIYQHKKLPKPIRHSLYRKLRRRGVTPSEEFNTDFFGMRYQGNVKNQIDADVFFYGGFEKTMLFFLRDFMALVPGVFVDVGANVGNHSLFMSLYAEKVHSFEPFPPVLEKMTAQIEANQVQNIDLHRVALGDEIGSIPFYAPPEESLGGGSFLESVGYKHGQRPVLNLPVERGDDYFESHQIDSFSAIKIDVEGFEIPVLRGLSSTLNRVRPLIVMEVTHGASNAIKTTTDIMEFLPVDYELFRFENRDDRMFKNQNRASKKTGRYRIYPVSGKVHKKRADVVACPRELLDKLPMKKK